jgi:hypothetical protein
MQARLIWLVFACASCIPVETWEGSVSSTFATARACPADRQTVHREPPPPDIAADPQRRALWLEAHHVYKVEGCGEVAVVECNDLKGGLAPPPWIDCTIPLVPATP